MMFDHVDDLTLLDSGARIHLVDDPQAWNIFRLLFQLCPFQFSRVKRSNISGNWLSVSSYFGHACPMPMYELGMPEDVFLHIEWKIIASVWYFYSDLKIELKSLLVVYGFPSLTACPKGHSKVLCLQPVKNLFELYVLAVLVLEFNRNCISIRTRSQGP